VADADHHVREDFRPLTDREREILELLLSVEVPGIEELRKQVAFARAARWDCGCASFDVIVDRERAPRSTITTSPAVEAYSKERNDPNKAFDLLLWVEDGWLAGVEIVDYVDQHGDDSPGEIPTRDYWDEPQPYKAPA
jgi:hypothetical protein